MDEQKLTLIFCMCARYILGLDIIYLITLSTCKRNAFNTSWGFLYDKLVAFVARPNF